MMLWRRPGNSCPTVAGQQGRSNLSINRSTPIENDRGTGKIKKILVISLTNIGDIVLTLPVVDILKQDFPEAQLSLVVGPLGETLLKGNHFIHKLHIFNKHQAVLKTMAWVWELRKERFDLVIDLRNTAIPFLIAARHKTSLFLKRNDDQHMRWQHVNRLRSVCPFSPLEAEHRYALNVLHEDKCYVDDMIKEAIGADNPFMIMSPGAADERKRWTEEGFALFADKILEMDKIKVVFVGNAGDRKIVQRITKRMSRDVVNLSGKTTLIQLAHLFRRCSLLVVSDSGAMHLASYLDVPVLGLFGPTDPFQYKPWGAVGGYIRKEKDCPACQSPRSDGKHQCMQAISAQDVFNAFELTSEGVVFK